MGEIWTDVKGLIECYQVSSIGRVRSIDKRIPHWRGGDRLIRGKILTPFNRRGYFEVNLSNNNKRYDISIHRLVAENFIDNPNSLPQVNHKDGDKHNNNVNNLEWVTCQQNSQHSFDIGLSPKRFGERNCQSKLTSYGVVLIRALIQNGMNQKCIAKKFNVSKGTICLIKNNRIWANQ